MITFLLGAMVGGTIGLLTAALLKAADEPEPQLPTLGQGTWLVCVDRMGEMTRCEPHTCFADAFERLEQAMREEP